MAVFHAHSEDNDSDRLSYTSLFTGPWHHNEEQAGWGIDCRTEVGKFHSQCLFDKHQTAGG